ncbi:NADPH-dependent FMN reductase [Candidatus Uabimicrobium amorphum]|uniref:FMN reductase n=1 Tax=Uabimicrobium amorphum TaxID=2596890 RepID=A0A5S9F275_UABAM|nr:NADPH-dependent FMN reductase [Candidatus Uabimicrobium amorphum]BBM83168.1 FMN reductase [Candidatus Uabimicrobium amorphum]
MESNEEKIKVIGISGSMRANSYTSAAVKIALEGAQEFGAEVELVELGRYELVFCNAENEENYPADVEKLRQKVEAAHGIIIGTPEYHGGYSGVLKNALDLMGFRQFEGKMMGLVGVAGGKMGAINALNGLRVVGRTLHSWVIPQQASISESWKQFDENGNLLDEDLRKQVRNVGQQIAKFSYLHHSNQAMEFLRLWESSIENPGAK